MFKIAWLRFKQDKSGDLKSHLLKEIIGTFALKILVLCSGLVTHVLLARFLGTRELGIYSNAMAWLGILSTVATLGLDKLTTKEVTIYQSRSEWEYIGGILKWSMQVVLSASLLIILMTLGISKTIVHIDSIAMLLPLWLALLAIPAQALINLIQAITRGLNYVSVALLPTALLQPLIFIGSMGIMLVWEQYRVSASWVMGIHILSTYVVLICSWWLLQRYLPSLSFTTTRRYQTRQWLSSAFPFLASSTLQIVNTRIVTIILAASRTKEEVGIFTIASRGSELITIPLLIVNLVVASTIARLYVQEKRIELQRLITITARVAFAFAFTIALTLIVFDSQFLSFFGREFISGRTTLHILSYGQLFNVLAGSVALLLNMTGYEHLVFITSGISFVWTVVLSLFFIPIWHIEGAAFASASSLMILNLLLAILVYKKLNIHTTPIGRFRRLSVE